MGKGAPKGFPAQLHFIQRFGSDLNLHIYIHAVVSDGIFSLGKGILGRSTLEFREMPALSRADILRIAEDVRKKVLKRFVRMGAIPGETARNMLAWPNSGFSLNAEVVVEAKD